MTRLLRPTGVVAAPTLRALAPDAADRLASFLRRLFLEAYADCSTPENVSAYLGSAFNADAQRAELAAPDRATWVLESSGRWLGVVQLRCPAPSADGVDLARPAQLHRLYLAREALGQGFGSRLLGHVRDAAQARGADGLWLGVWQQAPGPIAVYERHGFRIVGRTGFQVGGERLHDWIMQLRFDAAA